MGLWYMILLIILILIVGMMIGFVLLIGLLRFVYQTRNENNWIRPLKYWVRK